MLLLYESLKCGREMGLRRKTQVMSLRKMSYAPFQVMFLLWHHGSNKEKPKDHDACSKCFTRIIWQKFIFICMCEMHYVVICITL